MNKIDKVFLTFVILLLIFLIVCQQIAIRRNSNNELNDKIERLENTIDSISKTRDSIVVVIKEVDNKIEKNNQNYEKVVDSIISNPDSINRIYIDSYIKHYIDRITSDRHH